MEMKKSFASDNNSGVHPKIMEALATANQGHFTAYGDDPHTEQARAVFKDVFGDKAEVFFVFNGTGANVSALSALTRSWQDIICADSAHINVDECGAPEKITGSKLLTVPGIDGKITPELIRPHLHAVGFEHHSQPGAVSITQATELGTMYTPNEVRALADFAHENGMPIHMDGARLANAAAAQGTTLAQMTSEAGLDALSMGGVKNGGMFGEAVVLFNDKATNMFKYVRKQNMQLNSKMRYSAVQFTALLTDNLWKDNAERANAMARLLAEKVGSISGVEITRPVDTNGVFARIP